ncbi:MAG: amino acid adenylation domain-containing protein [Gammaproteobacteria bacterium]|nr:amino acid adenylation domain-containing protein [Gammaproteobacteria bacterium]
MTAPGVRLKELSSEQRELLLKRLAVRAKAPTPTSTPKAEPCLSFAQERWLFNDRLAPADPAHAIFGGLRLRGALDVAALQGALDTILQRHPPLRSNFSIQDGAHHIQIRQLDRFPLSREDLSGHMTEARLTAAYEAEIEKGFILSRDLLLRVQLLRLAQDDHALLFATHHIASDGWSLGVFMEELAEVYCARHAGRAPRLPALQFSYSDFAHWQRDRLTREHLDHALSYWHRHLAEAPASTDLRSDKAGGGRRSDGTRDLTGDSVESVVPENLTAKLSALGTQHQASLFAVLLTAYFVLLRRLTGQDDLVIGTPVSGRIREETERLIGLFLNTLALRAKLDDGTSFSDTLAGIHETILRGLEHHEIPFDRVVQEVAPVRQAADHPLFELMFNFTPSPPRTLGLAGLSAQFIKPPAQACEFSAVLYVTEWQGVLELRLAFQKARFSRARMNSLLDQYVFLLHEIVRDPLAPLSRIRLAPPLPMTPLKPPVVNQPTTECIAQWAARTPQAPALEWPGGSLNYAELNLGIIHTARCIIARGLARGEVVAVSGRSGPETVIGIAAVLRAGCVVTTLDPALPAARRALMVRESRAKLVICTDDTPLEWLAEHQVPVLHYSATSDSTTQLPQTPSGITDPGYLFFTSGTTGTPKAVVGSAGGLAHFLEWQRETFAIGPGDRAAQLTGLSFDVLLRDVFTPLSAGATLVLPPQEGGATSTAILHWLADRRITLIHSVPSLMQTWLLQTEVPALPALRLLFSAGEPLHGDLVTRWRARTGGAAHIVNLYGPTETTLAKCAFEVPDKPFAASQPVGRPIAGAETLIVRPDHELCAPGEPGEIAIRTPYRTLGYANDQTLTNERFVRSPGAADAEDVMYLTGDLGWIDGAGLLHVLGRRDEQVKIRGVRVEPQEVAAQLERHPDIESSAVITRRTDDDTAILNAYAVPAAGCSPTAADLRDYLRARLPDAFVPDGIALLEALPLTPNHKLDRARLPAMAMTESPASRAPRSPREMQMLDIWAEVLGRRGFGVDDDFFDLGGHSLLALRLLLVVEQRMKVKIPLSALFKSATVKHLVQVVERQSAPSQVVPMCKGDATKGALWLIHTGGGTIWNYLPLATELAPHLPVFAIQARGLMDGQKPQDDMREMAAAYLGLIRAQQPEGPYRLCGHSFGGVLAWEVVRQLRDVNCAVEALVMLDSTLHPAADLWFENKTPTRAAARDLAGAVAVFGRFTGADTQLGEDELAQLSPDDQVAQVAHALQQVDVPVTDANTLVKSLLAIAVAHRQARLAYAPPTLDVPVIYLKARESDPDNRQTAASDQWQSLTTGFFVCHTIGGDHVTMMTKQHAPELAHRLRSLFD